MEVVDGTLGGTSAVMTVLLGEMDGSVISRTLENGGDEKMVPPTVAIEREWGDLSRGEIGIVRQGIGDNSTIVYENS